VKNAILVPNEYEEADTSESRYIKPKIEPKYTEPNPKYHKKEKQAPAQPKKTVLSDLDEFFGESKPQESAPTENKEEEEYEYEEVDYES
jgi:hypothetical protein